MIPGLPGIELWIWPRHMLRVHGRAVHLARREGDLLSVLMSCPGRFFTTEELLAYSYAEPDAEPDYGYEAIRKRIYHLRKKMARHGITIDIRSRSAGDRSYRLDGFGLIPDWKPSSQADHRLSAIVIMEITSRSKSGEKDAALAAEYGIHPRTVRKLVKTRRTPSRRLEQATISEIRTRWREGTGPKALAYEYGVSLCTVYKVVRPERHLSQH